MTKPIVWIEWIDSAASIGWTEDVTTPSANVSVGFLVYEDDEFVQLACSYAPDTEMWNATISIPKTCIDKRDTVHIGWGENGS